jgi:hypothetical protein
MLDIPLSISHKVRALRFLEASQDGMILGLANAGAGADA